MAQALPSLRQTLSKMFQGGYVDGIVQMAGGNPAVPPYSNQQAQAECVYATQVRSVTFNVTDGGTAATAIAELPVLGVDPGLGNGIQVLYMEIVPTSAVTASNTNYASFILAQRTGGGAATTVIQNTTQVTDPVFGANSNALTPYVSSVPATAAAALVTSTPTAPASQAPATNSCLTFRIAKTGTGVALGSVAVTVYFREA